MRMEEKSLSIQDSIEEKVNIEEELAKFDSSANTRNLKGFFAVLITVIAVAMSLFHLYTAGFGSLLIMKQRSAHLFFVLI